MNTADFPLQKRWETYNCGYENVEMVCEQRKEFGKEDEKMIKREGRIKVKKLPNVTELAGEKVMVDFTQGKYFMLKGVGNAIWDLLEDNVSVASIIEKLLQEYDVEEEQCVSSIIKFLEQLEELEFIEGIK